MATVIVGAFLKLARNKREEVGAQWLGRHKLYRATILAHLLALHGGVRHSYPILWYAERQRVRRLEIGLVEAGKERAGTVGHKERVEELLLAV